MATINFTGDDLYKQYRVTDNFIDIPDFVAKTQQFKPHEAFFAGAYGGIKNSFLSTMFETVQRETANIYAKVKNEEMYTPEQAKKIFGMNFNKPVSAKYLHGFLDTLEAEENAKMLVSRYTEGGGSNIVPMLGSLGSGLLADAIPFVFVGFPAGRAVASATGPFLRRIGMATTYMDEMKFAIATSEGFLTAGMVEVQQRRDVMQGLKDEVNQASVIGAGMLGAYFGGILGKHYGRYYMDSSLLKAGKRPKRPVPSDDPQMSFVFNEGAKKTLRKEAKIDAFIDKELDKVFGKKSKIKDDLVYKSDKDLESGLSDVLEEAKVGKEIDKKFKSDLSDLFGELEVMKTRRTARASLDMKKAREALKKGALKGEDAVDKILPDPLKNEKGFLRWRESRLKVLKNTDDVIDPEDVVNLIEVPDEGVYYFSNMETYTRIRKRIFKKYVIDPRYEMLKENLLRVRDPKEKRWIVKAFRGGQDWPVSSRLSNWPKRKKDFRHQKYDFEEAPMDEKIIKLYEQDYTSSYILAGVSTILGLQTAKEYDPETLKTLFRRVGYEIKRFLQIEQEEWQDEEKDEEEFPEAISAGMHLVPLLFSNHSIETISNLLVRGMKLSDDGHYVPLSDGDITESGEGIFELFDRVALKNWPVEERIKNVRSIQEKTQLVFKRIKDYEVGEIDEKTRALVNEIETGVTTDDFGNFLNFLMGTMDNETMQNFLNMPEIQSLKLSMEEYIGKQFTLKTRADIREFFTDILLLKEHNRTDMLIPLLVGENNLNPLFSYNSHMIFDYPFEEMEKKLEQAISSGVDPLELTQKEREELFGMSIDELSNHVIRSEIAEQNTGLDSYLEIQLKSEPTFNPVVKKLEDSVIKQPPANLFDVESVLEEWSKKFNVGVIDTFQTKDKKDKEVIELQKKVLNADNVFLKEAMDISDPKYDPEKWDLEEGRYISPIFFSHGFIVSNTLAEKLEGLSFGNFYMMNFDYIHKRSFSLHDHRLSKIETEKAVNKLADLGVDAINFSHSFNMSRDKTQEMFKKALDKGIIVFKSGGNTPERVKIQGQENPQYDNFITIYGLNKSGVKQFLKTKTFVKTQKDLFKRFDIGGLAEGVITFRHDPKKREAVGSMVAGTSFTAPMAMASYLRHLRGSVTGSMRTGPYLTRLFHNYGVQGDLPKDWKKQVRIAGLWDWMYKIKAGKHYLKQEWTVRGKKVYDIWHEEGRKHPPGITPKKIPEMERGRDNYRNLLDLKQQRFEVQYNIDNILESLNIYEGEYSESEFGIKHIKKFRKDLKTHKKKLKDLNKQIEEKEKEI